MQNYLQNIRLVVKQNRNWFNRTYTGEIEESLRITKYNNFVLLINEVGNKIEQIQGNIVMSRYGIAGRFFLTNDEIDHFDVDSLKMRYMKSSMGSIDNNLIVFANNPKTQPPRIPPIMPSIKFSQKPNPPPRIILPAKKPATIPIIMYQIITIVYNV